MTKKRMCKRHTFLVLTFLLITDHSATAQIKFSSTFSTFFDWCYSVLQTNDSAYVVAGVSYPPGSCCVDVSLIKYNYYGDTLWSKYFGGTSWDGGYSVCQTQDSGFVIVGKTESFGFGTGSAIYLIRTDSNGNLLWSKSIGKTAKDFAGYSVIEISDGGYMITGGAEYISGNGDVCLIRTDVYGNIIWSKIFGGANSDFGNDVKETQDKGFIVVGNTWSFGLTLSDIYLLKVDSLGNIAWSKTYGGPIEDRGESVQETTDGGFLIGGEFLTSGIGGAGLIKTDSVGNVEWAKTYKTTNGSEGLSAMRTQDGGYILSGSAKGLTSMNDPAWDYIVKTDSNGDTLWTTIIGYQGRSFSIDETLDGGYILGSMNNNIHLIKMDEFGNTCFSFKTPCIVDTHNLNISMPPTLDSSVVLQSINPLTQVSTGGNSFYNNNCTYLNISGESVNLPFTTIYPNPFHSTARLENRDKEIDNAVLKIYNTMGILIRQEKILNLSSYILHRDAMRNGLYFYELRTNDNESIATGKFIIE